MSQKNMTNSKGKIQSKYIHPKITEILNLLHFKFIDFRVDILIMFHEVKENIYTINEYKRNIIRKNRI